MNRKGWAFLTAFAAIAAATGAPAQMQVLDPPAPPPPESPADRGAAPATPCVSDPFTIAGMPWPSATILAHVHARILEAEFGCGVRVVSGDLSATISSMATTRQPAVAPELWVTRAADLWNGAIRAGAVRAAGQSFSGGALEGWFIPDYVRDAHPGLLAAADLADHWQVFVPEGEERARFVSCPPDWACALINRNLLAVLGLEERFEIVEPEDRFALDRLLADAVSRREPVVFYYWQPNAILAQLAMLPLEMGAYDANAALCLAQADCIAFAPSAFAPDSVVAGAAEWVFTDAPEIAAYFRRAAMPFSEINRLLAWQSETGADPEEAAAHFLATAPDVWRPWVGAE